MAMRPASNGRSSCHHVQARGPIEQGYATGRDRAVGETNLDYATFGGYETPAKRTERS